MDSQQSPSSRQLTNRELLKGFFEALTDIEKRLIFTVRSLTLRPEKVILRYLECRDGTYTPPFRYLLFVLFLSYLFFILFYSSGKIDSPVYNDILEGVRSFQENFGKGQSQLRINQEAFNVFYLEFNQIMTHFYKLLGGIGIPAVFISFWIFYRPFKFNLAGLLVLSTFLASHLSLASTLFLTPLSLMFELSWFHWMILPFFYILYAFWRIGRFNINIKRPFFSALTAAFAFVTIYVLIHVAFGVGATAYIQSYTPSFIESLPNSSDPSTKSDLGF